MSCQNCGSEKEPTITDLGKGLEATTCPDCGAYDIAPSGKSKEMPEK